MDRVAVPDGLEFSFNSASGGMVVTGLNGRFFVRDGIRIGFEVDDSRGNFGSAARRVNIEFRDCSERSSLAPHPAMSN